MDCIACVCVPALRDSNQSYLTMCHAYQPMLPQMNLPDLTNNVACSLECLEKEKTEEEFLNLLNIQTW